MKRSNWKMAAGVVAVGAVAVIVGACSSSANSGDGGVNCGTGSVQCGDTCTVLARDAQNCGQCGKACAATELCSAGSCVPAAGGCTMGTTKCGNECVDTKTDDRNCGVCGTKCGANKVCSAGACADSCAQGTMKCGQACVDTQTDRTNCGGCGTTCADGQICAAAACTLTCQQGLTKCPALVADGGTDGGGEAGAPEGGVVGDYCVNLLTDNANCGSCGNACGQFGCNNGKCQFAFHLSQVIDGQTVTCSSVSTTNTYTECDDLKEGNMYFPNGITCGPTWSTTNSAYSDTLGFCRFLTGNPNGTIQVYYACTATVARTTWKNHVWGTYNDNGYTQHVRCFY